ncbi:hypothetical protein, partial [Comamonas thiooxydans]|uniref:hypothetical protein n=1 Tax=Comamonas thiooxydans TaxID=363952 RepID=UPI001A94A8D9
LLGGNQQREEIHAIRSLRGLVLQVIHAAVSSIMEARDEMSTRHQKSVLHDRRIADPNGHQRWLFTAL